MLKIAKLLVIVLAITGSADVRAADSRAQENSTATTDRMHADLNNLTSSDATIRRKSLAELVREIEAGLGPAEGRYSNYGSALLPVLHRVILDLDDPHAKKAVEAIFWLGTMAQLGSEAKSRATDDIRRQELVPLFEKVSHYPVPSDYAPLKGALINVLRNSKNTEAKYWAALSLADGFEPVSEVEDVLAAQLPIEEPNWRVQSAVLGSLSEIADQNTIKRATEIAIIDSLMSTNKVTRQTALEILTRHQYDGALDALIDSLPTIGNTYELSQKLGAIPRFGPIDDAQIENIQAKLEELVANLEDGLIKEELNKGVQSTIETLKYANIDKEHRFGMIQVGLNSIFLHTLHRGLIAGTSITTIGSNIRFTVIKRSDSDREKLIPLHAGSRPVVTYDVAPAAANTLDLAEIDNRIAYFSIDLSVQNLSSSSCTSTEGIHHSVWSTEGSERVRLWSAYQALGYATEPTCSNDELAHW